MFLVWCNSFFFLTHSFPVHWTYILQCCDRAFCGFAQHFPEQAAVMLNSFDTARQRQLLADIPDSSIIEGLMARSTSRPGTVNGASKVRSASAQRRTSTDQTGLRRITIVRLSISSCLLSHIFCGFRSLLDFSFCGARLFYMKSSNLFFILLLRYLFWK